VCVHMRAVVTSFFFFSECINKTQCIVAMRRLHPRWFVMCPLLDSVCPSPRSSLSCRTMCKCLPTICNGKRWGFSLLSLHTQVCANHEVPAVQFAICKRKPAKP
jgi:hypothetical protein